jgi:hypothetical protein
LSQKTDNRQTKLDKRSILVAKAKSFFFTTETAMRALGRIAKRLSLQLGH